MAIFETPSGKTSPSSSRRGSSSPKERISSGVFKVPSASPSSSPSSNRTKSLSPRRSPKEKNPDGTCYAPSASTPPGLEVNTDGIFEVPSGTTTPSNYQGTPSPPKRRKSKTPGRWPSKSPSPMGICKSPSSSPSISSASGSSPKGLRGKKRGRLGAYQGAISFPTAREVPGKAPWFTFGCGEPGHPGWNWFEGDVWEKPILPLSSDRRLDRRACREVHDEDNQLGLQSVSDVQKALDHPNLVGLVEHDGFGTQDTRKETAWEFCDAGTLNQLILAHKGDALPESLIWHTLQSLLQAVLHLSTGRRLVIDGPSPPVGWKPILHNLINPANVFYCHPRKYKDFKQPTYGVCKLGNFTSCVVLGPNEFTLGLSDLWDENIEGEFTGYEAPERSSYYPEARIFGAASDVWSIGAVAVAMMTGQPIWHLVMRENINASMMSRRNSNWQTVVPSDRFERLAVLCNETPASSRLRDALPLTYSPRLKELVERLVHPNPFERMDVQKLVGEVMMANLEMQFDAVWKGKEEEYVFEGEPEELEEFILWLHIEVATAQRYLKSLLQQRQKERTPRRIHRPAHANNFPDLDPEADDIPDEASKDADDLPDDEDAIDGAREHYVDVGKSKLRKPKDVPLGPQYRGSRVRRDAVTDGEDEDDPFSRGFDEEDSEEEDAMVVGKGVEEGSAEEDEASEDEDGETPDTDVSDEDEEIAKPNMAAFGQARGDDVRLAMLDAPKVTATLSQANQADAEKGRAVKRQRTAFDSLLGTRMKLQKALVGANTVVAILQADLDSQRRDANAAIEAAETAAFSLWSTLSDFRDDLIAARTGEKRKRASYSTSTATSELWAHTQAQEADSLERRNATLAKWSAKTAERAAAPQRSGSLLSGNAPKTTVMDVIQQHLSDTSRLLKRAHTPRSCAPVQISNNILEDDKIYDDADFYGLMLKELLEQKSADSVAASNIDISSQMRREAKTKKQVDVKASKGRKLRYTVHEKLQNFMAPEDRRSWGERQTDELFGSLFGQRLGLGEGKEEIDQGVDDDVGMQEAGLMLFRS